MQKTWITFALAILAVVPISCKSTHSTGANAAETASVMAPIHQFADGFNKGDTKSATAACADSLCIIDDFPPHAWQGAGAMSLWMTDFEANAKKNDITESIVKLGHPLHVNVTGDRAYVVVPADYTYKAHGKSAHQHGSLLTVALEHKKSGWLITGWSWSQN
jgi:hypothetical protein